MRAARCRRSSSVNPLRPCGAGVGVDVLGVEAVILFCAAFPLSLLGLYLGDRIHMTISDLAFRRIVCGILIVSGVLLLLKS